MESNKSESFWSKERVLDEKLINEPGSLPPRSSRHRRRRGKRRRGMRSPFLQIILFTFLAIIITMIILSLWQGF